MKKSDFLKKRRQSVEIIEEVVWREISNHLRRGEIEISLLLSDILDKCPKEVRKTLLRGGEVAEDLYKKLKNRTEEDGWRFRVVKHPFGSPLSEEEKLPPPKEVEEVFSDGFCFYHIHLE